MICLPKACDAWNSTYSNQERAVDRSILVASDSNRENRFDVDGQLLGDSPCPTTLSRFNETLKHELETVDKDLLPLQQGLTHSSYVSNEPFKVMIISTQDALTAIQVKAAIFYSGIVAGCNCADDPTHIDTQTEYCEVILNIDKTTAETTIQLHSESTSN